MNETCSRVNIDDNLIDNAKAYLLKDETKFQSQVKLFSLLGSDVRLKIIQLFLCYEKMCVCDLSDVLGMKQSPISQHLRKLKDGGLLKSTREGMTIFYSIDETQRESLSLILK